jgi:hypothetical protein
MQALLGGIPEKIAAFHPEIMPEILFSRYFPFF